MFRYVFLILGFAIVVALFEGNTTTMGIGGAVVYAVFMLMGRRKDERNAKPGPRADSHEIETSKLPHRRAQLRESVFNPEENTKPAAKSDANPLLQYEAAIDSQKARPRFDDIEETSWKQAVDEDTGNRAAGGELEPESNTQSENETSALMPSKGRNHLGWIVVGVGLFVAIFAATFLSVEETVSPPPPPVLEQTTMPPPPPRPLEKARLRVWNAVRCEERLFPQLYDPEQIRLAQRSPGGESGIIATKLYCSRKWDTSVLAKTVNTLRENRLLPEQRGHELVSAIEAQMAEIFPEPVVDFMRIVRVLPLAYYTTRPKLSGIMEQAFEDMRRNFPNPPTFDDARNAAAGIDFGQAVTVPRAILRIIKLNDQSPKIRLITDLNWSVTLEDLARATIGNLRPQSGDQKNDTGQLMIIFNELAQDNWPYLNHEDRGIITFLRINTLISIAEREQIAATGGLDSGFGHLRDIDIVFKNGLKVSCDGNTIDVMALYCPGEDRIYIVRQKPSHNTKENPETEDSFSKLPPEYFHEAAHYFFERKATRKVPFLAEGEATAAGELMKQTLWAAAEAWGNPNNRDLTFKFFKETGSDLTEEKRQRYMEPYRKALRAQKITQTQRNLLCLLSKNGLTAKNIRRQIQHTPLTFEEQSNLNLAYAHGWVIYHIDRLDHIYDSGELGWAKYLEGVAGSVIDGRQISDSNLIKLGKIAEHAMIWVQSSEKASGSSCSK